MSAFKKALIFAPFALLSVGCEDVDIKYEGKFQPRERVERIIENKLELENPDLDLEVEIYADNEDGIKIKSKKKE